MGIFNFFIVWFSLVNQLSVREACLTNEKQARQSSSDDDVISAVDFSDQQDESFFTNATPMEELCELLVELRRKKNRHLIIFQESILINL